MLLACGQRGEMQRRLPQVQAPRAPVWMHERGCMQSTGGLSMAGCLPSPKLAFPAAPHLPRQLVGHGLGAVAACGRGRGAAAAVAGSCIVPATVLSAMCTFMAVARAVANADARLDRKRWTHPG